jgi:hypothetical protein
MALLTSPLALGGIAVAAIVLLKLYSLSVLQQRYATLGARPPQAIRSKSFGMQHPSQSMLAY